MRHARALSLSLALLAVLFSFIKLFTYQYVLRDDPTTGLALRATPAFDNGPSLLAERDLVLIADENDFLGEGLYGAFSRAGWVLAVATPLVLAWRLHAARAGDQARRAS